MDCSLNNTKIKIQWIQKEFKRASILETELGINLDKQKQLISHCAFPLSRYLFFVFPRSFFSTKTENDRSISSRILLNELFSAYIGDRWSLRSNKSPMFFHLEAHPFVFFPRLLPYLHPVSLSLFLFSRSSITPAPVSSFLFFLSSPNVKSRGRTSSGICVSLFEARVYRENETEYSSVEEEGEVGSDIECVWCNRDERCVGKRKTRDNLRTIGRDDPLLGRGGRVDGEQGLG